MTKKILFKKATFTYVYYTYIPIPIYTYENHGIFLPYIVLKSLCKPISPQQYELFKRYTIYTIFVPTFLSRFHSTGFFTFAIYVCIYILIFFILLRYNNTFEYGLCLFTDFRKMFYAWIYIVLVGLFVLDVIRIPFF